MPRVNITIQVSLIKDFRRVDEEKVKVMHYFSDFRASFPYERTEIGLTLIALNALSLGSVGRDL